MFFRAVQAGQGGFEGTKDLFGDSSTSQSRLTVSRRVLSHLHWADHQNPAPVVQMVAATLLLRRM